jgi:hypothetical protein
MAVESQSRRKPAPLRRLPHYRQTTDFTCGPASLMMAMKTLAPQTKIDRGLELQLWREANTIFMGPSGGHGGCSALGLALAGAASRPRCMSITAACSWACVRNRRSAPR